jgi:hypothetical protein
LIGILIFIASISELVQDGVNGHLFQDSAELSKLLVSMLNNFPSSVGKLQNGIENYNKQLGWEDCWNRDLLPYLTK